MISPEQLETHLQNVYQHLKTTLAAIQSGRANTGIVDNITVEAYGTATPLNQVASVTCPDAKTIRIEPWDKSLMGEIASMIQSSNIGINPQNMGEFILLPIPPMTEDRRKDMIKIIHKEEENSRIVLRNKRNDARDFIKKQKENKEISEDEYKSKEEEIQEKINKASDELKKITTQKEESISSFS